VYPSLQDFVAALEKAGELHRVSAPVSPLLEIAEIADRQCKAPCPNPSEAARAFDPRFSGGGGKALLFENVEGCDFPVLINAYGSYRRTEMALNCVDGGFEAIAARLASLTKPEPPKSLGDLFRKAREFLPLLFVAYGVFEYLRLAHVEEAGGSPVEVVFGSPTMLLAGAGWALATLWSLGLLG